MNELATYSRTDRLPAQNEAQEYFKWSAELAKCPHYQRLGTGGILAILLTARELQLPPMACLNGGMYHLDGKVSLSAQMINSLLLKKGHRADIKILTAKRCVIEFKRVGDTKVIEYEYNWDDAVRAGYDKKLNYKQSPKDMLFSRCLSGGARKITPDALVGSIYCHGELMDDQNGFESLPNIEETKDEVRQISFEKAEGFDDFVEKHGLNQENTEKKEYITVCSKATKLSPDETINHAVKNEQRFLDGFKKWAEGNGKNHPNKNTKEKKAKPTQEEHSPEQVQELKESDQDQLQSKA